MGLSAAAFGAAFLAPVAGAFAATGTPKQGGTISLVIAAEPPVLTAIATTAFNTVLVSAKVTEGLLTYDFDLNPKPQLATAWFDQPGWARIHLQAAPGRQMA